MVSLLTMRKLLARFLPCGHALSYLLHKTYTVELHNCSMKGLIEYIFPQNLLLGNIGWTELGCFKHEVVNVVQRNRSPPISD